MKREKFALFKGCYFQEPVSWKKKAKKRMIPPGKIKYFYSTGDELNVKHLYDN